MEETVKCIKLAASVTTTPGKIERVADEAAHKMVKAGTATYTNKAAWKAQNKEKTNERG